MRCWQVFTRSIKPNDWTRFEYYAKRIKALAIDDGPLECTIDCSVFHAMTASRDLLQRPGPLFPNLTSLECRGAAMHYIRYFLSLKCRKLRMCLFSLLDESLVDHLVVLDSVKAKSPLLETVSIYSMDFEIYTELSSTLSSMTNLRAFDGSGITLTIDSIAQLSHLHALRELRCNIPDSDIAQSHNVTSKLQAIEVLDVQASELLVVTRLFAVAISTSVQKMKIVLCNNPSPSDIARFFSVLHRECGSKSVTHVEIAQVSV